MTLLRVLGAADAVGDVFYHREPDSLNFVLAGSEDVQIQYRTPDGTWFNLYSSARTPPLQFTRTDEPSGFYRMVPDAAGSKGWVEEARSSVYGIEVVTVPGAPDLDVEAGDTEATLTFGGAETQDFAPPEKYQHRRRESGGAWGAWADVAGGAAASSLTVDSLVNGTTYGFQVRAVNAAGNGAASAEVTATPSA